MGETTGASGETTRSKDETASAPKQSIRELTRTSYATSMLFGILLVFVNFCFDGCGMSRVASYFSHYHGSAGYSHLAIVGNLHTLGSAPDSLWNNLYYGSKLSNVQEAGFDVVRSEVPVGQIEHLFIPDRVIEKYQPKPGGTYCFHVSHVGNYYTFALLGKYGFEAYRIHEVSEQELPTITLKEGWAEPFRIYALCSILLPVLFLFAFMRIVVVMDGSDPRNKPQRDGSPRYLLRLQRLLGSIPFVLLYLGAAAYVAKLDWIDDPWPVGKALFAVILFGAFFFGLCKKPEPEGATAAPSA